MTGGLFSKREITSQLEIALQEQLGVDFEYPEKEDYLELVQKLEEFDSKDAVFYRSMVE